MSFTYHSLLFRALLWMACGPVMALSAQEQSKSDWKLNHISVEQGLSNRFINGVVQDNRGYIWFCTNFGINRYDGHRIDVLTRESHGLSTNTGSNIYLDPTGHLWIIHRDAYNSPINYIDVIDPITFEVKPFESYLGQKLPFTSNEIASIQQNQENHTYLLTRKGAVFVFNTTGIHQIIKADPNRPANAMAVNSMFVMTLYNQSDTVDLWLPDGTWQARLAMPRTPEMRSHQKTWIHAGEIKPGLQAFCSTNKYENSNDYCTVSVLAQGTQTTLQQSIHSFNNTVKFNALCAFDPLLKRIWCTNGLFLYNLDPLTGARDTIYAAAVAMPRTFYCDKIGSKWISLDDGVYKLTHRPTYFKSFLNGQNTKYSSRSFTEDRTGRIYLHTLSGQFIFDPERGTFENWPLPNKFIGLASLTDRQGDIWFTIEGGALLRYSPATQRSVNYNYTDKPYYAAWSILRTRQDSILIGAIDGLWIKNPNDENVPLPFAKLNGFDILRSASILHMLETDEGIWLCTDNGLFRMTLADGVLEHISDKNSALPFNNLLFLYPEKKDVFWIASRGGGLIRWDRTTNAFQSYTINEGLSHNIIYAIYEDDNGFFWMPSDFGLMRFEKATGFCRTFLPSEGIPHEEFNRTSYYKDSKGRLYFGGLDGFIMFDPRDLHNVNAASFPVQLTRFEAINEKTGKSEDLTYLATLSEEIVLSPQVSSFVVHYSILDYDDPQLKRYAYRIDGLNSKWTYITDNFIRINGLQGGTYSIRIKGQSATGGWSENELVIPLHIQKPVLTRWYAQVGFLLLLGGLFYYFYRRRNVLNKAKLQQEMAISQQLRQVDKLKDQFLANTSHELRTPLNGIVGLSESLLEKINTRAEKEDLELIISSGRRLSNLVNDILDFSRLKEHDLHLKRTAVDIRTLTELCLRTNRHAAESKHLALNNFIPTNLPYCLADENRLQQILQNLIANAIKFTPQGSITVDAQVVEGMIITSVSDTGIGIDPSKQQSIFNEFEQADGSISREYGGTGLGLSITKYLVELHGGSIGVVSEPGKGSVFSFSIPVFNGEVPPPEIKQSVSVSTPVMQGSISAGISPVHVTTHGNGSPKRQILVVDDEPVNLKVLKNHLERAHYEVTLANDGHEALELIEQGQHFDLVLLDVMMPRMSGYEVCLKIREKYMLSEMPVIMVTAKNQVDDLVEGLGNGANDYIVKPFSRDELIARVHTQLDNHDIHVATNRFVPHEFIRSLGRQNIMELHRGDMVEQHVHVMFSDIRDYTALAEDMTPTENFKFVNALAGRVGPIVKANHGMINQYLGDTIMMLFLEKADHGMQTGIDILKMVETYNELRISKNRKRIRLGIGLHSGPLMMGIIGDAMRTDAAVISDTVNTASRMEGLTKFYNANFVLSGDALQLVDDPERFLIRYLGKVQAKGKHQSIDIYECYNGDGDEQVRLKQALQQEFHEGISAYFAKDMMAARRLFDMVYQSNPNDMTAFGFLHRTHHYIMNGLPENWNGVEVMINK